MDDKKSNKLYYKEIFTISTGIFLGIIEIYLIFKRIGIDLIYLLFEKLGLSQVSAEIGHQIVFQMFLVPALFVLILFAVKIWHFLSWRRKNKSSWVAGTWLHIHHKDNDTIRVGYVKIKQDYNNISVEGRNASPNLDGHTPLAEGNWHYVMGTVHDLSDTSRDYIGYYTAYNDSEAVYKDGIHALKIMHTDEKGYASYLSGAFKDTVESYRDRIEDAGNRCGKLYMFKISNKDWKKLFTGDGQELEKFALIHKNTNSEIASYVRKLNDTIREAEESKKTKAEAKKKKAEEQKKAIEAKTSREAN